jgi:hypothetical protein
MLPDWLTSKLADVPQAGAGIHAWLFSCARQLHAHMDSAAVEAVLGASVARADRRVPAREIRDAVRNSHEVRWQPKDFSGGETNPTRSRRVVPAGEGQSIAENLRWPKPDPVARRCRLADSAAGGVGGLVDLWERSPVDPGERSADDWIDILFPDAEWLCLATDHPATARSRRRADWSFGPADECGLIVPSPMTGPGGIGLDGRRSHRCLDNTGPRRFLVIEFDTGTIDEQAALHWHLRASCEAAAWPRLVLTVHSAGKSLHGWYGPVTSEDAARELMAYAAGLGADTAGWNRCQLMRLPGGVRKVGIVDASLPDGWDAPNELRKLEVFFFDPTPLCLSSNISSSAPGVRLDSTQRPEAMAA